MVEVQSRLRQELGREITITELFRWPTIRQLGGFLSGDAGPARPAPVSSIQGLDLTLLVN
jgi:hypothetical protein